MVRRVTGLQSSPGAGSGLVSCLLLLSADRVTVAERNNAARLVLGNVRGWVGPFLRRASPCHLDEDDEREVVQHLLTRCCTGSAKFRGNTDGEAHSWCRRVFQNKARDLCRQRRRLALKELEPDSGPAKSERPGLVIQSEFNRIIEAIVQELTRLHREQDLESLRRSLRCHIEARFGATIEEQIESYGFSQESLQPEAAAAAIKARNRVYQYRKRGRAAGCEALTALVAQGRFTPTDVTDVQRILGCDVQAPAAPRKSALS